ncbi:MAG: heme-binding protein [Roseovarius sp.]|nr:heme-binding protein [Roseovarius sp.]
MFVERREISAKTALTLAMAAIEHAKAGDWDITVAVCDRSGGLLAFLRTDNVVLPAVEFAIDKAYTAATLQSHTQSFGERMASHPTLSLGVGTRTRLLTWAGGLPIFDGGACVGGIGVSGAKDHEDLACARAALNAAGLKDAP